MLIFVLRYLASIKVGEKTFFILVIFLILVVPSLKRDVTICDPLSEKVHFYAIMNFVLYMSHFMSFGRLLGKTVFSSVYVSLGH